MKKFITLILIFILIISTSFAGAPVHKEISNYLPSIDGWNCHKIEDWSALEKSGFKQILYRDCKLENKSTLELKKQWLETMVWEAYSKDVALEFAKSRKQINSTYLEIGNYSFTKKPPVAGESIFFVDGRFVVNVIYHSNLEENKKQKVLNYAEQLIN